MKLKFFHDKDYGGFFVTRDANEVMFVTDSDVDRCNGSVYNATMKYGRPSRVDMRNAYHVSRICA